MDGHHYLTRDKPDPHPGKEGRSPTQGSHHG